MRRYSRFLVIYMICAVLTVNIVTVRATEETTAYPVLTTSNEIKGWPAGPEIFSGSAVVMEAETGTVLYDKNMNQRAYPASITKILTAVLALENCSLNEMVEFSDDAVFSVPRDSSHIAVTPGEFLSVENCLYGLLLASANEVANALGEHISGSMEAFVELMNERAAGMGAVGTHFSNTNGLPDENHYTTCYDMAMISRAAVVNESFVRINSTTSYMIPPTNLQPEERPVNTQHRLLVSGSRHYDGCFGGKTGYTSAAGNTLVTFAERNGMTLICVVMQSDSTHVYDDSTALLNYGFENFSKYNVSEHETKFNLQGTGFFESANSIFESSYPQIGLDTEGFVVLPAGADFSEAESEVLFRNQLEEPGEDTDVMADIRYTWYGHYVGGTTLKVASAARKAFSFSSGADAQGAEMPEKEQEELEKKPLKINVWYVAAAVVAVTLVIGFFYMLNVTRQRRARWQRIYRQKHHLRAIERRHRRRKFRSDRRFR